MQEAEPLGNESADQVMEDISWRVHAALNGSKIREVRTPVVSLGLNFLISEMGLVILYFDKAQSQRGVGLCTQEASAGEML